MASPSDNSGTSYGWIVLASVVAAIGAGYLYQREGGKISDLWNQPKLGEQKSIPLSVAYG